MYVEQDTVKQTAKGDWMAYLAGGRQVGRADTEPEAQKILDDYRAQWRQINENAVRFHAVREAMVDQEIQQQWQNWRSELYNAMVWSERNAARFLSAMDRRMTRTEGTLRPSYHNERIMRETDEAQGEARCINELYTEAFQLDLELKRAYRDNDPDEYRAALENCEEFMAHNRVEVEALCAGAGFPVQTANAGSRSERIQSAAMEAIEFIGVKRLDDMSRNEYRDFMRPVYARFAKEQGCHIDTAKRHLARAMRRQRDPNWAPPQRGGAREGAGRPASE